jgi:hypothetical protein
MVEIPPKGTLYEYKRIWAAKGKAHHAYEQARNSLIPAAEAIANKKHGAFSPAKKEEKTNWRLQWSKSFSKAMTRLSIEAGLIAGDTHENTTQG